MKEEWRDINGYIGLYQVSNFGNVKSLKTGKLMTKTVQELRYGYKREIVNLHKNKKGKTHKVHRLVANAFLDNKENGDVVNHKDCNPLNNNLQNLEWTTTKGNVSHAVLNQRNKRFFYCLEEQKKEIFQLFLKGITVKEIAEKMGTTSPSIYYLLHKEKVKRKPHINYKSKYNIDIYKLKELFEKGERNMDIAKWLNCPQNYIAKKKQCYKKGEF